MIHRLTAGNIKRILTYCLNDPGFARLYSLIQRCQFAAADPERYIIIALDACANAGEVWGIGLYLLSHLTDEELDLTTTLVRTANYPRGVPTWRWERAALASLRWRAADVRSWKGAGLGPKIQQRRKQQETAIKLLWEKIDMRLQNAHERALIMLNA